jgi:hypothetical protein
VPIVDPIAGDEFAEARQPCDRPRMDLVSPELVMHVAEHEERRVRESRRHGEPPARLVFSRYVPCDEAKSFH